jgi:hypothetical protein
MMSATFQVSIAPAKTERDGSRCEVHGGQSRTQNTGYLLGTPAGCWNNNRNCTEGRRAGCTYCRNFEVGGVAKRNLYRGAKLCGDATVHSG